MLAPGDLATGAPWSNELIPCHVTGTNERTHYIIAQAIAQGLSPEFDSSSVAGGNDGNGPRFVQNYQDALPS